MRLPTSLLLLAGASTCVSAHWTDYLNKILKIEGKQVTLEKTEPEGSVENFEALIARRVRNITSENWLSLVQPSSAVVEAKKKEGVAAAEAAATMPAVWYYYFTSSAMDPAVCGCWDAIFNHIVYTLADNTDVNFGKADCAMEASRDLCRDLYITSRTGIPRFYHLVAYTDKSLEIRELPPSTVTPFDPLDQFNHYTQFLSSEKWRNIQAWAGVFNPINGTLKGVRPYVGIALTYYEYIPQRFSTLAATLICVVAVIIGAVIEMVLKAYRRADSR